MAIPGWLKNAPNEASDASDPPQLLLIAAGLRPAAVFSAAPRLANELVSASTSTIRQFGQTAETMSTSSEISAAQPASLRGYRVPPRWSILRKQPLAVVHAGSPNVLRYTARSASAVGSSNASTIATVRPAPAVADGSLYAGWRSAGPYPAGVAAAGLAAGSVRTSAWQAAVPGAAAQTRAEAWT